MLRHAVMQMQLQTYPVDHAIYINAPFVPGQAQSNLNYEVLAREAARVAPERLIIRTGPSGSHHQNYMSALLTVDPNDYDLFVQVDDDDLYFAGYVEGVVQSYLAGGWDYSGSASDGVLLGATWNNAKTLDSLGLAEEELALGIPAIMPPTIALSRQAVLALMDSPDNGDFHDRQWRRYLAHYGGMTFAVRPQRHFVYHVHGKNASTGFWLTGADKTS